MTDQPQLAVVDFLTHNKVAINAQAETIWPRIVDLAGWRSSQTLVLIGGELDEVGARFHAVATEAPTQPLFVVENVEMVAGHRRTIRLEGLDGHFIGFATWELTAREGQTVVAYDVYCRDAMLPGGMSQAELSAMSHRMMEEGLNKLKAMIEA